MIKPDPVANVVQALKAIPDESLEVIRDLPVVLTLSFVSDVQAQLRRDLPNTWAADIRINALLLLKSVIA